MRRARGAALGAGLLVLVAGCGAPTSGRLTIVDATELPYGTAASSAAPAPEPSDADPSSTGPRAYFVLGTPVTLRTVRVDVRGLGARDVLRRLLDAVAAGPTTQQRDRGLSTAFPPGTVLRLEGLEGGTARIQVRFADQPPATDILPVAVGQLVLTATSVPGIGSVALVDGSAPVPAPLPGGRLVDRPVTAADYAALLRPPTTTG